MVREPWDLSSQNWLNGNSRTARIMATLVLNKRGFDVKRFFTLDDYYRYCIS